MKYIIVDEWAAPTYYDHETGEMLYDECDSSIQRYWVATYDTENKEIVEWVEPFMPHELDKAHGYINELKIKGAYDER